MDNNLIHKLSKEQEDVVLTSVGYTREQLNADLKQIREWLEQQPHLPECRKKETDAFLQWYLTGCKGSLETVKKKLDNYYTFRSYSEIFDNRDPLSPEYIRVRRIMQGAAMPQPGYNGDRLCIFKLVRYDPEIFDFLTFAKGFKNGSEVYSRLADINSRLYVVIDCRDLSPSITLKIRPSVMQDILFLLQEVTTHRFVKISFIHTPSYVERIVNILIKPFLSTKLQKRFHVTSGGHEDIFNYFSPSIVPKDYGGDISNPELKYYSDLWVKYEQDNRDWFLNELSERIDEFKRITTVNTPKNPYFGVHGSIKKLVID